MIGRRRHRSSGERALACVIGGMDLVTPLGLAGIRCALVGEPANPARYSRFTDEVVDWAHPYSEADVLLDRLVRFGAAQPRRPVLYYEGDWDLLLVSRRRDHLACVFDFVVPDAELVEDLVDKARFQLLAERLELPVPRSRPLSLDGGPPTDIGLPFPLILKPHTRRTATWQPIVGGAKALVAETPRELRVHWDRLREVGVELVAQEMVPGPETRIESYHAYVDNQGGVVGEFTGRKIRTYPASYGYSTALEITDTSDVRRLGRELVERLRLHGVAKLDFKRDTDGRLRLLEVNPRFSLWHHPGAKAGVNLPALVYEDLTGAPRGQVGRARQGVRWCWLRRDARAARQAGIPLIRWIPWALSCEAKSGVALDDPMPLVGSFPARVSRRRAARSHVGA